MKRFEYADKFIGEHELMIAVPSIVIGVGILSLPKHLASVTIAADGLIPILVGGVLAIFTTWMVAKIASNFPGQSFFSYASCIVTKPVAFVLTLLFAIIFLQIAIFQIRQIADVSKQYIFESTPVEVIALTFLLVVIYAVAGSRAGLFRLNMMFLPIILFISLFVIVFSFKRFESGYLFPMFETKLSDYMGGLGTAVSSYTGFAILWFYIALVKKPKKAPKSAALGMCIPVVLYAVIYIVCIGVFGNEVTRNLMFPTVELAKEVEIPGEFFERFESLFFTIWIMAIFNTTALSLDISVFALTSIFKKLSKIKVLLILSPLIYITAMFPKDYIEMSLFGTYVGYLIYSYTLLVTVLLLIVGKLRGIKTIG